MDGVETIVASIEEEVVYGLMKVLRVALFLALSS